MVATIPNDFKLLSGDILDFWYGYGFDADYYDWDKFYLCYFDNFPIKKYDGIVCINVINVVSSKIR